MGHKDIKSTMVYLKGLQSKDVLAKINGGALAEAGTTARWKSSVRWERPEIAMVCSKSPM
jgi:hypothetical protein